MASQKESLASKYQFSGWRNVGFREGNSKLFHIPIFPIYLPFRNIWLLTLQLAQLCLKSFLFFDQPQWFDVPGHGNHTKTRSWVRKKHESLNGAVPKTQPIFENCRCHLSLFSGSYLWQKAKLQLPGILYVWGRSSLHPCALIMACLKNMTEWWKYDYDLFHLISLKKHHFKPVALCSNPTVATTYAQDPLIEILPSQPSWLYTLCFSLVKHQHVHLTIAPRAFIFSI